MVFPLHEETLSREEARRLAKARYHKIHTLGEHLAARKNLSTVFEAMAEAPKNTEVPSFCEKNKRKNYVPRRILQVCSGLRQKPDRTCRRSDKNMCAQREPLADITNLPETAATEPPRSTRRRINPTPTDEASLRQRLLLLQALQFIYDVDQYTGEHRVTLLLDMIEVFRSTFGAVDRVHVGRSDQDAGREADARPAVH
ncbi:g8658 [Coccomyxa elongata]